MQLLRSIPLRPRVRLAAKIALTLLAVALVVVAMHGVPLHGVIARGGALPAWALVAALGFSLLQVLLLAARLWLVFPRGERPSPGAASRAYAFGQLANGVLPGRAGDVLKFTSLRRRGADGDGRATSATVATAVVLDRLLDFAAFGLLALVFGRPLLAAAIVGALHFAWVVALVVAVLAIAALAIRRLRPDLLARLGRRLPGIHSAVRGALDPPRLVGGLALGAASWAAELAMMVALGAGLGLHLSIAELGFSLVVLNLGIAVPISVANVGTYEAAMALGLSGFGVSPAAAIAFGALHHVLQLAGVLLAAGLAWAHGRMARARAGEREPVALLPAAT